MLLWLELLVLLPAAPCLHLPQLGSHLAIKFQMCGVVGPRPNPIASQTPLSGNVAVWQRVVLPVGQPTALHEGAADLDVPQAARERGLFGHLRAGEGCSAGGARDLRKTRVPIRKAPDAASAE